MNVDKVNQWLTLAGNVGVIAGIVFLALEIRQNTSMMQSQTRDSMTEKQMMFTDWIGTDIEIANILGRGQNRELQRGTPEYTSFIFLYHGIWREWENSLYQYRNGLFTESEFRPRQNRWRMNMSNPGTRELWSTMSSTFSLDFQQEMEVILNDTK
ncbi:MAG TPA: hypothetical protein DCM64_09910 [Gammaproteobacteria bacterium]|jgi:hypothetical protein|nr:hypothetical protein [Gammaproteobacteria bacterium]|tara:strand:- start:5876 stop:6340 length:465 start_codon:yes stop_codon:yes gene_type:complete